MFQSYRPNDVPVVHPSDHLSSLLWADGILRGRFVQMICARADREYAVSAGRLQSKFEPRPNRVCLFSLIKFRECELARSLATSALQDKSHQSERRI